MSDKNSNTEYPEGEIVGDLSGSEHFDLAEATKHTQRILARRKNGGRYLLEHEIARGGMGVIHSVYDQDLRRNSAVKVISGPMMRDERKLHAFVKEARITALLEHPNIIPVHEIGMNKSTGHPYYTMKRVEGRALSDVIFKLAEADRDTEIEFPRHRLLDSFRKVCDAVSYAHSMGVIHRDIKPENIMVGDYGEVLLMDWGLAKFVNDDESSESTHSNGKSVLIMDRNPDLAVTCTEDGVIKGSLAYLSPEQAFGDLSQVDHQSDIFLLGATLYHILTHFPPYYGRDLDQVLDKAEKCDFLPPSARNPAAQIPLALERIILKAMSPMKQSRYHAVQELIGDLDAFISGRRVCGRQVFAPGEKIIEYGDTSRDTFVIISGCVQVNRLINGVEHPIATLGRGEIIGEMAGITHQNRSATVIALETTDTLVITHDLMIEELEKLPPWMENIVFSMAERVRVLDATLHPLMLKNRAYPVITQLYYIFSSAENYEFKDSLSFKRKHVLDEISLNLGIDRESIVKVTNVLIESGLVKEEQGVLAIANLKEFALFVDYCRCKFEVSGGVKDIRQVQLPQNLDSFFRQVVRTLRGLKMESQPKRRNDPTH